MRNPGGWLQTTSPDGVVEHDTFTCAHCQRVTVVRHRARGEDMGGLCRLCYKLICPACVGHGCVPFEKNLDHYERTGRWLRE